jgi:hypothetical protein
LEAKNVRFLRHQLGLGLALATAVVWGLLLAAAPAAAAIKLWPEIEQLFSSVEMEPPSATHMTVCYGFTCRLRLTLVFTDAERTTITNLMNKGRASAVEERKAIQQVFVWFDRRVGREVGTDKRVANADVRTFDASHNFDCWDTTRNAASLLLVLQDWNLLRHHRVSDPRYRGNILVGQLPHNTAVIKETAAGGTSWVVDMWPTAYGQVPDVMTLEKWLDEL